MAVKNEPQGLAGLDIVDRLKEISDETTALLRQEVQLARAELSEKVDLLRSELELTASQASREIALAKTELTGVGRKAGVGAGLFSAAGLFALACFATMTAALVAGIAEFMPAWASALIVTALYGAVAGALALAGKSKVKEVEAALPAATEHISRLKEAVKSTPERIRQDVPLSPERTINSLKESKEELAAAWQRGGQDNPSPS